MEINNHGNIEVNNPGTPQGQFRMPENERFCKHIYDHINIGIFQLTPEGVLYYINPALSKILGYDSVENLLSHTPILTDILDLDPQQRTKIFCEIEIHGFATTEMDFTLKDGTKVVVNLSVWGIKDEKGNLDHFEGFVENITERVMADEALHSRDMLMKAISIAAEEFLQTPDLNLSIQETLGRLGEITNSSRVYIFRNEWTQDDDLVVQLQYEWVRPGISSLLENPLFHRMSYQKNGLFRWMEMLSENKAVGGYIDDFPEVEKKVLTSENIKSIIMVSILVELDWWGFIGFDTLIDKREFYTEELDAIKAAANIFGAALHRQKVEEALQESRERFQTVADFTNDWEYWVTPEGKFIYSSPAFKSITGYNPEYLPKDLDIFRKITHPEDFDRVNKFIDDQLAHAGSGSMEFKIIPKSGDVRWIYHVSRPIYNNDGRYLGQRASNRDITAQKKVEEKLNLANQSLNEYVTRLEGVNRSVSLLSEMSGILQSCLNEKDVYAVVGQYCEKLFLQQSGALYMYGEDRKLLEFSSAFGKKPPENRSIIPDDCWAIRRVQPYLVSSKRSSLHCQHVFTKTTSEFQPYLCVPVIAQDQILGLLHIIDIPLYEGEELQRIAMTVAERAALTISNLKLREKLRLESIRDSLTGLYNRRYMEEMLQREIHRSDRHQRSLVVMFFDIDRFKIFNDTFGHAAGDEVLKRVGSVLQTQTRSEDIACRYGGEEFILILPETRPKDIVKRAELLRQSIKNMKIKYQDMLLGSVTVSVGMVSYTGKESSEELIQAADKAMFKAKDAGRDQVFFAE